MTHTSDPHLFERPINILVVAVAETAAPSPVNPFEANSLASRSCTETYADVHNCRGFGTH